MKNKLILLDTGPKIQSLFNYIRDIHSDENDGIMGDIQCLNTINNLNQYTLIVDNKFSILSEDILSIFLTYQFKAVTTSDYMFHKLHSTLPDIEYSTDELYNLIQMLQSEDEKISLLALEIINRMSVNYAPLIYLLSRQRYMSGYITYLIYDICEEFRLKNNMSYEFWTRPDARESIRKSCEQYLYKLYPKYAMQIYKAVFLAKL